MIREMVCEVSLVTYLRLRVTRLTDFYDLHVFDNDEVYAVNLMFFITATN